MSCGARDPAFDLARVRWEEGEDVGEGEDERRARVDGCAYVWTEDCDGETC